MNWMNDIGGLLQQYTGGQTDRSPADVENDFQQAVQAVPQSNIAEGISSAFNSDRTPPFEQMVGQLFGNSNGQQKAGMLNSLLSGLGGGGLSQLLAGGGLAGLSSLLGGGQQLTPEQAQQVPPETVQAVAAQAQKHDPSVVDRVSNFYSEHPALVSTLGAAALSLVMSRLANRQR